MQLPTTLQLVEAWESASAQPTISRSVSLLPALGLIDGGQQVGDLVVGDSDWLLLQLRTELFGAHLETVVTCPTCREVLEFDLDTGALLSAFRTDPLGGDDHPIVITEGDLSLEARLVTNADLVALSRLGRPVSAVDLARLCVQVSPESGEDAVLESLPDEVWERVAAALADADPGSSIQIELRCPCGRAWSEEFDIRSFLWTELTGWVGRRLAEVHQLATSYGWSETAILGLSTSRRRAYLEACGW